AVDSVSPICADPFDRWNNDPSFDDNDSAPNADPITVNGGPQVQYFCSTVDQDWVSFKVDTQVDPNVSYQVETSFLSPDNDTLLDVYQDVNGAPIRVQGNDDTDDGTYGSRVI